MFGNLIVYFQILNILGQKGHTRSISWVLFGSDIEDVFSCKLSTFMGNDQS